MLIHNGIQIVFSVRIPCDLLTEALFSICKADRIPALHITGKEFPAILVSIVIRLGAGSGYDMQFIVGINLFHIFINGIMECFEAGEKLRSPVLVSHSEVVQRKWFLMSHFFAE